MNSLLRDALIDNVLSLVFSKNLFVITEATVGGLILLCFDPQAISEKKNLIDKKSICQEDLVMVQEVKFPCSHLVQFGMEVTNVTHLKKKKSKT